MMPCGGFPPSGGAAWRADALSRGARGESLEWLGDIEWADKAVPDAAIYVFSLLGFALFPAHLGRKVWALVAWFVAVNVAVTLGHWWEPLDWQRPWLFAALGQLPWILFVLDLLFRDRLSGPVAAIPMNELLLWHAARLMGVHFIVGIYGGYAPQGFSLEAGFSEIITALGALLLWLIYSPDRGWFRTLLIFWNTYGLTSALVTDYRIFLSNPNLGFARYSREIFQYMTGYPQSWMYCFWLPIAIGMHAAIFYKMYVDRKPGSA
jgi:hypothetical protein